MSSMYTINFFAWCREGTHDKIWGYVTAGEQIYNFWGRRGARFQFRSVPTSPTSTPRWSTMYELRRKAEAKCARGRKSGTYTEVPQVFDIAKICDWPTFEREFETQLVQAKISDSFHYDEDD